ncbi:bifunctional cytidylyltransferase/SDR family oxidoreductase [Amnibacterium sp. CER49]|uniref:bifunctional cytidylyltransferase/SDR family oxidoreductase n=1 Tax=Amnibacterium sp. CER49 TaxID=3039161 RepID=UPI002447DCB9|nr:bifunctional cytidylyltransferase/SDR family oxidoreductase [Amnibacterium sp. CER49]MDH2443077.1 bifunctional cytidylyltransferase/SDR family oxidoreductase [Amnibacterium sp. CER49]
MASDEGRLRTVAVILAGGVGVRAGLGMPKQLARIAGKPIIEHTIAAVDAAECIDEIIVMMEPNHMAAVEALIDSGRYPKLTRVFEGGESRNDTTRLALAQLGDDECKVLFHDAVRPFVDERILQDCVDALDHYGAVDTAIPSADTIIQINTETNVLVDVPPRALLRRGQTPQGFLLSAIRHAYERAARDRNFVATDDCTVVLKYTPDVPIAVVAGSDENMKITESIDVFIADKLFQLKSSEPGGLSASDREQRLTGKTVVVFGGSEGIGKAIADAAQRFGASVFAFSRSTTGTDIRKRKRVVEALRQAVEASGRIDYVVNSAGVLEMGGLDTFSHDAVKKSIQVNLLGPIMIAQESLPYLRETRGQLLYFTSSSYTRGRANYGVYSATKAATVNLTQSLSEEWADLGVRVNCINPERTKTGMRTRAFGAEPEGTLLAAETVALASIDTLLSDATGQIVDVRRRGEQQPATD